MTTMVTVKACCDKDTTEVLVKVTGEPDSKLQDGEENVYYCHDEKAVTVSEVKK